jgi:predicted restriction endonuclease
MGERKMKFELREYKRNITEDALIKDLNGVASLLQKNSITKDEYQEHGRFGVTTFLRKFGSWNKALEKAGLKITNYQNSTEEDYFKNLEEVWIKLGRQPYYREVQKPFSKYSVGSYEKRFGTWQKALEQFIKYINSEASTKPVAENISINNSDESSPSKEIIPKHKTKRTINNRLRVQVLIKDGNKCKICGKTVTGDDIHIDHVFPWSKGGETALENLQVLCSKCNIGKSDL